MKKIFLFLSKTTIVCVFALASLCAWADLYTVTGVPVAAERTSALQAKEAALAEGQVTAFNKLMSRLAGSNAAARIPQVTEESVLDYVLGVSIEREKTTATKYTGSIAVQFDPEAIKGLMKTESVPYLKNLPHTLVVVPVYKSNGQTLTADTANPLYRALKSKGNFAPFYQATLVSDSDRLAAEQAMETMASARTLAQNYGKERVMFLTMSDNSDNTWTMETSFAPAADMEQQQVVKKFKMSSNDVQVAAGQMADLVFEEMENRWRNERTDRFQEKQVLYLRVPVNSLAEWQRLEKQMKSWTFFDSVEMKGLYLPQVLVEAVYQGDVDTIAQKLSAYGWQLDRDFTGNGATLVRKVVYE